MMGLFRIARPLMAAALVAAALPATAQTAQPGQPPAYLIGPDDTLTVIVYGQPEFNVATRVKADGTIVVPLLGIIKVQGETNISLAKLMTEKLVAGGFLKAPLVNVEISAYVSRSVNIAGAVASPGILPLDRPYHVLEALLKAGWVRADGANFVYLRRQGQPVRKLAIDQLVRGDANADPLLLPGDTVYVPPAEVFFIYGPINAPGMKAILPGMTVRQAIGLSGGVTPAGRSDKVRLIRGNKEIDADVTQTIEDGDVIIIRERLF